MTVGMEAAAAPLGGWLLLIPLAFATLASLSAALWFLRRSRGRRVVPAECRDRDPSAD